jgi:hypothetical protein
LAAAFSIPALLAEEPGLDAGAAYRLREQFEVSGPERRFARALLRAKTNLWLFRTNKTLFCGDFITVDRSSGDRRRREVQVLELKAGEAARRAGGHQVRNWPAALAEIAERWEVVDADHEVELVRGGEDEVLAHLGVDRALGQG